MGYPVLVMGESGTGKSTSLRNFEPGEIGLVNVLGKPLPFRQQMPQVKTKNALEIASVLSKSKARSVVIDDFGYTVTDSYMKGSYGPDKLRDQYDVYKKIGSDTYNLVNYVYEACPADMLVYFVMHTEIEGGQIVPATVGKMLNEKIKLVGMFTLTLLSMIEDGEYRFLVNGRPPAKTPPGMFEGESVPNDLKAVDAAIRDYYCMEPLAGGDAA